MNDESETELLLCLAAGRALSPFRRDRLLGVLRERIPGLTGLSARFLHFVALQRRLDAGEHPVLERLLHYGSHQEAPVVLDGPSGPEVVRDVDPGAVRAVLESTLGEAAGSRTG